MEVKAAVLSWNENVIIGVRHYKASASGSLKETVSSDNRILF